MSPTRSLPHRIGQAWVRALRHLLPPTLYFFAAFNLISFTTDLLAHNYWFRLSSFMLATTTALVVGKVVLVVDKVRLIDKFRGGPLIRPILYKAVFYSVVVLVVRFVEKVVHFAIDTGGVGPGFQDALRDLSWNRFVAVHLWIFVCFLIYVTASEFNALVGRGQLFRLFFHHRSSEYGLTRQQHIRSLMELGRLAETTPRERLFDPATPQGSQFVAIVDALHRRPA
ncbi:MAG: hypothetical protein K2Y40_07505 [Reyranella sp.]|nr:hypothetical protein [Reyranella sp.]